MSKNDANTGLRVLKSIQAHGLPITRAAFTCGRVAHPYIRAFGAHLFLSAHEADVRETLQARLAAAVVSKHIPGFGDDSEEVRIAFDGDNVLFGDESERVYQAEGLNAFFRHEVARAEEPLPDGPFRGFLDGLHIIRQAYEGRTDCPIRIALVTARNAPAHERPIKTLRKWGIHLDETFFLGGLPKTPILEAFRPHIFFDDQTLHSEPASVVVPSAHVPVSVTNEAV